MEQKKEGFRRLFWCLAIPFYCSLLMTVGEWSIEDVDATVRDTS
jgi:hypothetical protein